MKRGGSAAPGDTIKNDADGAASGMIVTAERDRLRAEMTTTDAALPSFGLADGSAERRFPTGRSTLLCFVKEDCPTCRLSMPLIREMQERYGEAVDVWAVGQDAAGNAVLMDEYGLPGPMLDDSGLGVSYAFAIDTVPTLILTDGAGRERRRFHGFGRDDFRDMTTELSRLSGLGGAVVDWDRYPVSMPGCGSKSMEPGIYERLQAEAEGSPIRARRIEVGAQEDVYELLYEQGVTDGLPVLPPTPERVVRMLETTDRDPQEEIAVLPPNLAPVTIEKVAINAVLAGCKPEYFPVVLAATEAVADERFNVHGAMATTMGGAPVLIVNGPVRDQIGMNSGQGALGQGNRANATIGRAVRLVVRNMGGHRPGGTERATISWPGKYTLCFAEAEEVASSWTPLHVERGFAPGDSVVTALIQTSGPSQVIDETSRTPEALAGSIGLKAALARHAKMPAIGETLIVISPEHYRTLAAAGWSKDDVRRRIQEVGVQPLRALLADEESGGLAGASLRPFLKGGDLSGADLDRPIRKFRDDDWLMIVVAGGGAGKWSAVLDAFGTGPGGTLAVSKKIAPIRGASAGAGA